MPVRINKRLAGFAQQMRREPTEPEKRLWRHLSNSQLGGFKFRRQSVIADYICDFLSPYTGLIVEVDGDTHWDEAKDQHRDNMLTQLGYTVLRFSNHEVLQNMEGVLTAILRVAATLPERRYAPTPTPPLEGRGF